MANNTHLEPFRQFNHLYDVIDLFKYSGSIPVTKGTVVKAGGSGWRTDDTNVAMLGNVGAGYGNTVSQRYGITPYVVDAATGDVAMGILLKDVREYDENGEKLVFHPRHADERNYVMSGQPVPVLQNGWILYSGTINGPVTINAQVYPSGEGHMTTNSVNQVASIGSIRGLQSSEGNYLLHINVK